MWSQISKSKPLASPRVLQPLRRRAHKRVRARGHCRRHVRPDPDNCGGGATWRADSGQRGPVVAGAADEDDAMLVHDLVGEGHEAADVGRARGLAVTG